MEQIDELRKQIDNIDRRIVGLIETRLNLAKEIGAIKKAGGMDIEDCKREDEVLKNVAGSTKLDKKFIKDLYGRIIEHCKSEEGNV
jgi:chorismate mutase